VTEVLQAKVAGLMWVGVFILLALAVRRRLSTTVGPAVLATYPVYFAFQVVLANVMGATGLLAPTAFRFVYGVAAGLGVVLCIRGRWWLPAAQSPGVEGDSSDPETRRIRRIVVGTAVVVIAGLTLFTLISPIHIWDALAYHMPMVASYIQNGSLDAWPTQDLRHIYRVNAGELQMLNLALLARSDAWVELPNLLGLIVVLIASFELGRLTFRRTAYAYLVVILVLTAPQIVLGAATEKNDLVFTAALLCAFYWIIRAGRSSGSRVGAYVLLAALSSAVAGATKVMGLNVVGAVGLLALVLAIRHRLQLRYTIMFGGTAVAALLLLVGKVYLGNLGHSAVPVGVAPGEVHYTFGLANIIQAARFYLYDLPFKRLVSRPVFEHDFMHYGYLFPFMLVLGLAAAFQQLRERRFVPASLAFMGASLVVSVIAVRLPIGWDQRFMIWLVPTLAILALSYIERLDERRVLAITWVAAVLALGNLGLALTLESDKLFSRSALHLVATHSLPRYIDVANQRYPHMKDGFATLDRYATNRDSILYAGTDDSWMYPAWGPRFTRHVEGVWDADHAGKQVSHRQFRFVVVEAEADPEIRRVVAARTADSGYRVLVNANGRTIFVRGEF
jgi:hypothetical protein